MNFSIPMNAAAYATFLSNMGKSQVITDQTMVDANNGHFQTSDFKFKYVYEPSASNLVVTSRNYRGTFIFADTAHAISYFNDALAH